MVEHPMLIRGAQRQWFRNSDNIRWKEPNANRIENELQTPLYGDAKRKGYRPGWASVQKDGFVCVLAVDVNVGDVEYENQVKNCIEIIVAWYGNSYTNNNNINNIELMHEISRSLLFTIFLLFFHVYIVFVDFSFAYSAVHMHGKTLRNNTNNRNNNNNMRKKKEKKMTKEKLLVRITAAHSIA